MAEQKKIKVLKNNEAPPYIPNNINSTTVQEYLYDTNQLLTRILYMLDTLVNRDQNTPKVIDRKNVNVLGKSQDRDN